jgi:hypothetical protein
LVQERILIKVKFGSEAGTPNLKFGRVFVKYKYVRAMLLKQTTLPFEVMLFNTGKGQDRGKDKWN